MSREADNVLLEEQLRLLGKIKVEAGDLRDSEFVAVAL